MRLCHLWISVINMAIMQLNPSKNNCFMTNYACGNVKMVKSCKNHFGGLYMTLNMC